MLIVGNGIRVAGATELLYKFYEKTKIPILTSMNAVDLLSEDKKIGFIGVYGNRIANMIVDNADLVIAIGVRLGIRQIGNKPENFAPNARLIRVDVDEYELARTVKIDEQKYLMDAKKFLNNLFDEDIPTYDEWNDKCFNAKSMLEDFDKDLGNYCVEKISKLLPENPIITVDVGQNQCWSAQSLNLKGDNGRILIGGGYGSMGCALPYAIGATYAINKGVVYCITGDGGLQMNIQELQCISSENLPIKILVINNRALGKISEIQAQKYDRVYAQTTANSGYTVPDFEKVAIAYGIKATTLDDYDDLSDYKEWLYDNEPCLINILLPEDTKLSPKMNWNKKEMLPILDIDIINKVDMILSK